MIISNAKIVLEDQIVNGYIEFNNKQIIAIKKGKTSQPSFNAKGLYLLPAFIDSHTHGGYGLDFNMLVNRKHDKELKQYLDEIHYEGVGSILMTTVTCSDHDLNALASNYQYIKTIDTDNVIKGWYIEGPYISVARKGAHNPKLIRPIDLKELQHIKKVLPKVTKVLAVAPEYKNNWTKFNKINKDYFLATGHSDADYQTAMKSFDLKARRVVHLYNALPDFNKRHPTIINAIFNRDDLTCELICDKAHVSPETILNTYKILGANQIAIISDSLMTKGLKDGSYNVWGIQVDKRGALDYLKGTSSIAGGNLPFNKQVENFGMLTKCSMQDILKVSSLNSAKSIKQQKHFGNIVKGAESNFILLNSKYELKATFIHGKLLK